jgi:uncharacterized membrane protein
VKKSRLEAFSDGVIAIIITIMVLELRAPHAPTLAALQPLLPVFASYVVSFVYVGIYWNNHHHLWQAVDHVNGPVLWANLHLLFWLSLFPFVTSWAGESGFATVPMAIYGAVLLFAGVAYTILVRTLVGLHGRGSLLARAVGADFKGNISLVIYIAAIALAFVQPWCSCALYVVVAIIWLVPDRRIERILTSKS